MASALEMLIFILAASHWAPNSRTCWRSLFDETNPSPMPPTVETFFNLAVPKIIQLIKLINRVSDKRQLLPSPTLTRNKSDLKWFPLSDLGKMHSITLRMTTGTKYLRKLNWTRAFRSRAWSITNNQLMRGYLIASGLFLYTPCIVYCSTTVYITAWISCLWNLHTAIHCLATNLSQIGCYIFQQTDSSVHNITMTISLFIKVSGRVI